MTEEGWAVYSGNKMAKNAGDRKVSEWVIEIVLMKVLL